MNKFIAIKTTIFLMLITPLFCHAEETLDKPFISKPFMKFGRGMVNTISSPLELPNQMYLLSNHARKNSKYGIETASAAIEGTFMGVVYTFWRLGAGTYDLLTFLIPKYEFCLITPTYFTVSYKEYYEKEKRKKHEGEPQIEMTPF